MSKQKKMLTKTNVVLTVHESNYILTTNYKLIRNEMVVDRDLSLMDFINARNSGNKVSPSRIKLFNCKDVQKAYLNNNVRISTHASEQMRKRGYSKADLIAAIWTSKRTELQCHRARFKAVLEGLDKDNNPICIIVGSSRFMKQDENNQLVISDNRVIENPDYFIQEGFTIISVFPPVKEKFIRNVLHHVG